MHDSQSYLLSHSDRSPSARDPLRRLRSRTRNVPHGAHVALSASTAIAPSRDLPELAQSPPLARQEVVPRELSLQRLCAPSEIAEIHTLRQDISLPAALRSDPAFLSLEKKEMKSVLCAPSYGRKLLSAP